MMTGLLRSVCNDVTLNNIASLRRTKQSRKKQKLYKINNTKNRIRNMFFLIIHNLYPKNTETTFFFFTNVQLCIIKKLYLCNTIFKY